MNLTSPSQVKQILRDLDLRPSKVLGQNFLVDENIRRIMISRAGISPDDVTYINAHGTATPPGDLAETKAIKRLFGDHAYRLAVSSTKSSTGHLLGAAGGVETAITAWAVDNGIIPPTINYQTPDPDCDLDCVPNEAREAEIRYALTNSFGFGGTNASLMLKKFEA